MSRRSRCRPGTVGVRAFAVLLACIGVALALGVVARSAAGSAFSFAPAKNYVTGITPAGVAIGDLNGDGRPDLVIANVFDATVSVLIDEGDGSFLSKRDYATGRGPASPAISDLNGDGKPDLVTANLSGNAKTYVSVLLNKGDGSFMPKIDVQTGSELVARPFLRATMRARASRAPVAIARGCRRSGRARLERLGRVRGGRRASLDNARARDGSLAVFALKLVT